MSPTSHYSYSFSLLILVVLGCSSHTTVNAELDLSNIDTDSNMSSIGIALAVLALVFILSFVGYNYCFNSMSPDASTRAWRGLTVRGGLDPSVFETFPVFPYSKVSSHKSDMGPLECAVCLGEFEQADELRLLPKCNHVFHVACVDTWLGAHSTCPLCRADLVPRPDESGTGNGGRVCGLAGEADDVVIEVRDEIEQGSFRKKRKCKSAENLEKIEKVDKDWERFTLKLPEEVRNDMVTKKIIRSNSCRQLYVRVE